MSPTDSPPTDISGRGWTAYFRQELTAPATALVQYAQELATKAAQIGDTATSQAICRICNRANHVLELVNTLMAPKEVPPTDDQEHQRTIRHDLRNAASYVVEACEDISEGSPEEIIQLLQEELTLTKSAARGVISRIELLVNFFKTPTSPHQDTSIIDMLKRIYGDGTSVSARTSRTSPGRILVVDDNEYSRDLIARPLTQLGHSVDIVSSGQEAQKRLCDCGLPAIDLILLDVMMPGITGPELLNWIKKDPRFWHLPVIMISALDDANSILNCIAAGAEDYLTRPVRLELLQARIAGGLDRKRLRDRESEYQARIDELVRAIFPPAIVAEWRATGMIRPRHHEHVGVLFLDISGFTELCEKYRDQPEHIVQLLQQQVEKFETTVARHGVQKVKTIGDGFLGVAGLPDPDSNPALTLLRCGLDLIADVKDHPAGWKVRVGVHVGPLVSGVLGKTQFSFDIWGHTVNMASRVESHGRPGQVTMSDEAWKYVQDLAIGESRQVVARGIGVMTVWDFLHWAECE